MNRQQKARFKADLESKGFLPFKNSEASLQALAHACSGIVKQGSLLFMEFHQPLREYLQELYDAKKILQNPKKVKEREKWIRDAIATGNEREEEMRSGYMRQDQYSLDTLADNYLVRVRESEGREFFVESVYGVLRNHFGLQTGNLGSDKLNLQMPDSRPIGSEDYQKLLKEVLELTIFNRTRESQRLYNLLQRISKGKPKPEELLKNLEVTASEIEQEEVTNWRSDYKWTRYHQLQIARRDLIGKTAVAYDDIDKAYEFVSERFGLSEPIHGRTITISLE